MQTGTSTANVRRWERKENKITNAFFIKLFLNNTAELQNFASTTKLAFLCSHFDGINLLFGSGLFDIGWSILIEVK